MRVPLLQGAYTAKSIIANAQREVNLYPERDPNDSPVQVTHYPTAGLRLLNGIPLVAPPPPPPPPSAIWAVTTSCKLLPFPPNGNGNISPLTNATLPDVFTLFSVDFDSVGNQYTLRFNQGSTFDIPIIARGDSGQFVTPLGVIAGASTGLSAFGNNSFGGLCVDDSGNIYAGNDGVILKFPPGTSGGDIASTTFLNQAGIIITSLCFDPVRQWIWLSAGGGNFPDVSVQAYDLSGTQKRNINDTANFNEPAQVAIGPDGSIFVADFFNGSAFVYVYDPTADGNPDPTRIIEIDTPAEHGSLTGVQVDASGLTYVSLQTEDTDAGYPYAPQSHILVFAADASGTPDPIADITGTNTLMDVPVLTDPDAVQSIRLGPA